MFVMFLSAIWTLILMAPIYAKISKSIPVKKLIYIPDGLRVSKLSANNFFGVNSENTSMGEQLF